MSRILSLAALTVLDVSAAECVRVAAAAGWCHVGVRLIRATPEEAALDLLDDAAELRALQHELADTGVQVLDVEIFRLEPATRVATFEPALACAEHLGAKHLLVAGNDPEPARTVDNFAALCELAARHGLAASLEFMPWTDAPNLASATRIVARAGHPQGAVLVDAFHLSRSRGTAAEVATLPRQQLRYLQLCDVPAAVPPTMDAIRAQARAERLFPGEGELDLLALLQAVPSQLPISVEVPTHTLARSVGATERARRALAATMAVLGKLQAL